MPPENRSVSKDPLLNLSILEFSHEQLKRLSPPYRATLCLWWRGSCHCAFGVCGVLHSVDLEEVVEDDEKHGSRAEEYGQSVELIVGNHLGCRVCVFDVLLGRCSRVLLQKPRNW